VAFLGEYTAHSIAHAFSYVSNGICEASYGSFSAAAAAAAGDRLDRLCRLHRLDMLNRFGGSGLHGCLRIC